MIDNFDELLAIANPDNIARRRQNMEEYGRQWRQLEEKRVLERRASKSYPIHKQLLARSAIIRKIHSKRETKKEFWYINTDRMGQLIMDFADYEDEYRAVYNLLSDDLSRRTYINLLAGRLLNDLSYVTPLCVESLGVDCTNPLGVTSVEGGYNVPLPGFPNGFISLREIFVDCGAYVGDTFLELEAAGLLPAKYYGFEPSPRNHEKLKGVLKKCGCVESYTWDCAVSNKNGVASFEKKETEEGAISGDGGIVVKTARLDDVISDRVTLIKMDIEGSEYAAIEGAASLIKKYKPKLAICLYHKSVDFRQIPLLIHKLNKDYKLFVRHTGETFVGTVCFACDGGEGGAG